MTTNLLDFKIVSTCNVLFPSAEQIFLNFLKWQE